MDLFQATRKFRISVSVCRNGRSAGIGIFALYRCQFSRARFPWCGMSQYIRLEKGLMSVEVSI